MRVWKRCACGAEIRVESDPPPASSLSAQRQQAYEAHRQALAQIPKWDKEHKGHGTAPPQQEQSQLQGENS